MNLSFRQPTEGGHFMGTDLNRNFGFEWRRRRGRGEGISEVYPGERPFSAPEVFGHTIFLFINLTSSSANRAGPWQTTCSP